MKPKGVQTARRRESKCPQPEQIRDNGKEEAAHAHRQYSPNKKPEDPHSQRRPGAKPEWCWPVVKIQPGGRRCHANIE